MASDLSVIPRQRGPFALMRSLFGMSRKAVTDAQFLTTTVQTLDGYGSKGPKARPFKKDLSIKWFEGLVYALTMYNAKAFAKVPIRLYVKSKPGRKKAFTTRKVSSRRMAYMMGDAHRAPSMGVQTKAAGYGDFEEVVDVHPITELLRTANQWQNGFELSILRSIQWQVMGDAYLWPEIDPRLRRPASLWLVPSQYTRIVPGTQGRYIDGYVYGPPQNPRKFGPDELIHFRAPGADPMAFYGMGRVEAAWSAINVRGAERISAQAMFDNGCRPDWAIIWKNGAQQKDMDRVEATLDAKFRGPNKAGSVLSVNGDTTIVPLQWSPKEVGADEDIETEICSVWQTPIGLIRSLDPNKANAQSMFDNWMENSLRPDLIMDEEQLNARYVPLFEEVEDAFLCYDDPVIPDEAETRGNVLNEYKAGLRTLAQACRELGMDEPADDYRVIPMGSQRIDKAGKIGEPVAPSPVKPPDPTPGQQPEKEST